MKRKVLIIEDDADIASLVQLHLLNLDCQSTICEDGKIGLATFVAGSFDLAVLDIMLPSMNGIDICKEIRKSHPHTPVLMLTAKSTELDRVLGLELGADDYLTKPFSVLELVARVKALFRRSELQHVNASHANYDVITVGDLVINPGSREVLLNKKEIKLTAKEFDLLLYFSLHPGQVFTRIQLLDQVWGYSHEGYEHTVNSHINRLRAKIEKNPATPEYILTAWGVGYKFRPLL